MDGQPTALEATWCWYIVKVLRGAISREVRVSDSTAKRKVLEVIERLPADATVEDAIEQLVLLAKVEQGLAQLDAGQGVEHGKAKRRLLR